MPRGKRQVTVPQTNKISSYFTKTPRKVESVEQAPPSPPPTAPAAKPTERAVIESTETAVPSPPSPPATTARKRPALVQQETSSYAEKRPRQESPEEPFSVPYCPQIPVDHGLTRTHESVVPPGYVLERTDTAFPVYVPVAPASTADASSADEKYPTFEDRARRVISRMLAMKGRLSDEGEEYMQKLIQGELMEDLLGCTPESIQSVLNEPKIRSKSFLDITDKAATEYDTTDIGIYLIVLRARVLDKCNHLYVGAAWGKGGMGSRIDEHFDPEYRASQPKKILYKMWDSYEKDVYVLFRLPRERTQDKGFLCKFYETLFSNLFVSWHKFMLKGESHFSLDVDWACLVPRDYFDNLSDSSALSGKDIYEGLRDLDYRGLNMSIPILEKFRPTVVHLIREGYEVNFNPVFTRDTATQKDWALKVGNTLTFYVTATQTAELLSLGLVSGDKVTVKLEVTDGNTPDKQWVNVPVKPEHEEANTLAVKLSGTIADKPWELYLHTQSTTVPSKHLKRACKAMSLLDIYYDKFAFPVPNNRVALMGVDDGNPKIWDNPELDEQPQFWKCDRCGEILIPSVGHKFVAQSIINKHYTSQRCQAVQEAITKGEPVPGHICDRCDKRLAIRKGQNHIDPAALQTHYNSAYCHKVAALRSK